MKLVGGLPIPISSLGLDGLNSESSPEPEAVTRANGVTSGLAPGIRARTDAGHDNDRGPEPDVAGPGGSISFVHLFDQNGLSLGPPLALCGLF